MLVRPLRGISCEVKPTKVNTSVAFPSGAFMLYLPAPSVSVPTCVFFIRTLTPGKVKPLLSLTIPVMVVCANALKLPHSKRSEMAKIFAVHSRLRYSSTALLL
ncbi:hypothetical protein D3C87_1129020 [compost metagenome]